MSKDYQLPNFHVLQIKFHGATNTLGARVSIYSPRFLQRVYLEFDYDSDSTIMTALKWLIPHGFSITGKAEFKDSYVLFSDTFKQLRSK